MKKLIAILSLIAFIMVGCEQASSIVAPDSNTNTELEKNDNTLKKEGDEPRP